MSGAKLKIATDKMKALETGDIALDRTFVVGVGKNTEEFHVREVDFKGCSSHFRAMLISRDSNAKIRIDDVEPEVFKLIVEFAHLCGSLVTEIDDLDLCLKLTEAAERYMVVDLGGFCYNLLVEKFIKVENVWSVFSKHYLTRNTAAACIKLLSTETKKCLQHPTFLEASVEAIMEFLLLKKMNIDSELELVNACIRYIESKENGRDVFRKFLPKLRIFTLKVGDLQKVLPFFSDREQLYLAAHSNPLLKLDSVRPELSIFCDSRKHRGSEIEILNLIDEHYVDDIKNIFKKASWKKYTKAPSFFKIGFVVKKCVKIHGFDIFCCLDVHEEDFLNGNALERLAESTEKKEYNCNLKGKCALEIKGDVFTREISFPAKLEKNYWMHIEHFVTVPEGCRVEFTVTVDNQIEDPYYLRMLPIRDPYDINVDGPLEYFDAIQLRKEDGNDTCIFKSVYFSEV